LPAAKKGFCQIFAASWFAPLMYNSSMSINLADLTQISEFLWEIPKTYRANMRVPARVYTSEKMLKEILRDRSLEQLVNITSLPGILCYALAMPDCHEGFGFPIGGVAATLYPDGIISPGGIGYDINCGVRLLKSQISANDIKSHLENLAGALFRQIPAGVGRGGKLKLSSRELDNYLEKGVTYAIKQGFGETEDALYIESSGHLADADPDMVSKHAKDRGSDQLGTMGAGNHFVEVDKVEEIFDEQTAAAFGLFKGQIVILIHTGSRGLGHQVATDHIQSILKALPKHGINLPDTELAGAPFSSDEGHAYFKAMSAAANFAWANRQLITCQIREAWQEILGKSGGELDILYDVAHNIAKIEEHEINGKQQKVIVHRKGATRAFPPGHPEITEAYRAVGQPVIIPGSMGTSSYVLAGAENSLRETFGSSCHGAGRRMSRHAAQKAVDLTQLKSELKNAGIQVMAGSMRGLAEEAPLAYKDIDDVIEVVISAQIAKKVARLKPLVVVKG